MIGIELKKVEVVGAIRKRGIPIDSFSLTKLTAILKEDGYITEVQSGEASVILRGLSKRFGPRELTLQEANEVAKNLN